MFDSVCIPSAFDPDYSLEERPLCMKKQARIYETKRADKVEIEIERGFADVRIERSVNKKGEG